MKTHNTEPIKEFPLPFPELLFHGYQIAGYAFDYIWLEGPNNCFIIFYAKDEIWKWWPEYAWVKEIPGYTKTLASFHKPSFTGDFSPESLKKVPKIYSENLPVIDLSNSLPIEEKEFFIRQLAQENFLKLAKLFI